MYLKRRYFNIPESQPVATNMADWKNEAPVSKNISPNLDFQPMTFRKAEGKGTETQDI